jgi:Tfp pilus assembly PilM family ATPase
LEDTVRVLLKKLKSRCRDCAISVWPEGARVKIFEGRKWASGHEMRDLIAADSRGIFNEALTDYTFDCVKEAGIGAGADADHSLFVGCGIPRSETERLQAVFPALGYRLHLLQLMPIAVFNAFAHSHEEIFAKKPYLLADIGKSRMTVVAGAANRLPLLRVIEFGWGEVDARFIEEKELGMYKRRVGSTGPTDSWGEDAERFLLEAAEAEGEVLPVLSEEEELSLKGMRAKADSIAQELHASVEFLLRDDDSFRLEHLYISGALNCQTIAVQILAETMDLQCVPWNPLRRNVATEKALAKFGLLTHIARLPAAAGAAFQHLL